MTSPTAARSQVATWSPSQTGPCARWHVNCTGDSDSGANCSMFPCLADDARP